MIDFTLPKTYSPSKLVGGWASGYESFTQIVDAYGGGNAGTNWQSGQYFKITDDGRNSELYLMEKSQYASSAIKAVGTIRFDVGSTADSGAFTFLALKAHYKGWSYGTLKVDRDATDAERAELSQNLQFYYQFETSGSTTWFQLRFDPQGSPTSFRRVQ